MKEATAQPRKKHQAVVVIHGIGEQVPNSTLRNFVFSIIGYEREKYGVPSDAVRYWVKPNLMMDQTELRRIAIGKHGNRPKTDFYEYYWAHNMRDSTFRQITSWVKTLFSRDAKEIPQRLRWVWKLIKSLIASVVSFTIVALAAWAYYYFRFEGGNIQTVILTIVTTIPIALSIVAAIIGFLGRILIGSVGDAARYLRVAAENVVEKEKIRKGGIELLLELNACGKYDRAIVVGHSLGSIIAYDIISHAWIAGNKNRTFDNAHGEQDAFIKICDHLRNKKDDLQEYRKAQSQLWNKLTFAKEGWLVSDLVTLGSPLAYGKFLMANTNAEFDQRIKDRELPVCPPVKDIPLDREDEGSNCYYYGNEVKRLHFATPFAPVKWSNAYYPGDLIGGDINGVFGSNIIDKEFVVRQGEKGKDHWRNFLSSHTHYWTPDLTSPNDFPPDAKEEESIAFIYEHLLWP